MGLVELYPLDKFSTANKRHYVCDLFLCPAAILVLHCRAPEHLEVPDAHMRGVRAPRTLIDKCAPR